MPKKTKWLPLSLILAFSVVLAFGLGRQRIPDDLRKGVYARPLAMAWGAQHGQPCASLTVGSDGAYAESEMVKLLARADTSGYDYLMTHRVTVVPVPGNLLEAREHTAQIISRSRRI